MNDKLAHQVVKEAVEHGVQEFCVCAGSRNSPFVLLLTHEPSLKQYFWFEERSAAFFALGRAKATGRPVAVITTSGTAAAELLPATMEAYYTGIPLLLITADRPRRFRGLNAPQTAEQVGLFGQYVIHEQDLANEETCSLSGWSQLGPAHLNVCFEEPCRAFEPPETRILPKEVFCCPGAKEDCPEDEFKINQFLHDSKYPLVIVSTLKESEQACVVQFLQRLNAPVYLEAISGLREESRLQNLRVTKADGIYAFATKQGYPIDRVIRIGGVPTLRFWRDLEESIKQVPVLSISSVPFSGLTRSELIYTSLPELFNPYQPPRYPSENSARWLIADHQFQEKLHQLFLEEPSAEPSLFHHLSKKIPQKSLIFLGISLPIREWDMAACKQNRAFKIKSSRGLSPLDGQISTFLGLSSSQHDNWAIIGDLGTLYDLAGPWILPQLPQVKANIVVINNKGGQIFSRLYDSKAFLNEHQISFAPMAALWSLSYEEWREIPDEISSTKSRIIEIIPDNLATERFWKKAHAL
jgi:2-succinyl-5-enolpyruvyl-6-hydroxy-3-cyclohexene-1-carboxylate synthase